MTTCTLPVVGFTEFVPSEGVFVGLVITGTTSFAASGKIGKPPSSIN